MREDVSPDVHVTSNVELRNNPHINPEGLWRRPSYKPLACGGDPNINPEGLVAEAISIIMSLV